MKRVFWRGLLREFRRLRMCTDHDLRKKRCWLRYSVCSTSSAPPPAQGIATVSGLELMLQKTTQQREDGWPRCAFCWPSLCMCVRDPCTILACTSYPFHCPYISAADNPTIKQQTRRPCRRCGNLGARPVDRPSLLSSVADCSDLPRRRWLRGKKRQG